MKKSGKTHELGLRLFVGNRDESTSTWLSVKSNLISLVDLDGRITLDKEPNLIFGKTRLPLQGVRY